MTDTIAHPPLPEPAAQSAPFYTAQQMREYRDAPAWQPIETAPHDKTVSLFHKEYAMPLTGTHGAGDLWVAMVPGVPMLFQPVLKPSPTHWQPLPAAPIEQPGEKK